MTVTLASLGTAGQPAAVYHGASSYCSESGDICQSLRRVDGVRKARIRLAERHFRRYILCVRSPLGYDACKRFRIEERARGLATACGWPDGFRVATACG